MPARCKILVTLLLMLVQCSSCSDKANSTTPMPAFINSQASINFANGAKTQLTILASINYGGYNFPIGPICTEAMRIALNAIYNASLLNGYNLVVQLFDDMCLRHVGIDFTTHFLINVTTDSNQHSCNNCLPLVIGPACAAHFHTGQLMQHYNFVGITPASIIPEIFNRRSMFSSFFSLVPAGDMTFAALPAFLTSNGWKKIYLLTETYSYWSTMENILLENMARNDISLAGTSKAVAVTGLVPDPYNFKEAVQDLAARSPRIIIVVTNYAALMACSLYEYNLYGPSFVLLFFGMDYFLPNIPKPAGCTEQMLYDVLQSVIYFAYGSPINLDDRQPDVLGVTPRFFDETLKAKIDRPELNSNWFGWRSLCYDSVVAAALALNSTEEKLQQKNDTLLNWVTTDSNFRHNGGYINSLLRDGVGNLRFNGLSMKIQQTSVNARVGLTAFFQIQSLKLPEKDESLSSLIRVAPIAVYDFSAGGKATVKVTAFEKCIWHTKDGVPPADSIQIFPFEQPVLALPVRVVFAGIACILLLLTLLILSVIGNKWGTKAIAESMPKMNILILIGNAFLICSVLLFPGDARGMGVALLTGQCSAAGLSLMFGFSLLTCTLLLKMHIAGGALADFLDQRGCNSYVNRSIPTSRGRRSATNSDDSHQTNQTLTIAGHPEFRKTILRAQITAIAWAVFQTVLTALWMFIQQPIKQSSSPGRLEISSTDVSLAYQCYSRFCVVKIESTMAIVWPCIFLFCYIVVFSRSIYLAVALRHCKIRGINDLHTIGMTSYSVGVLAFGGAAVIYLFFISDPEKLTIAISLWIFTVTSLVTSIIFLSKITVTSCTSTIRHTFRGSARVASLAIGEIDLATIT